MSKPSVANVNWDPPRAPEVVRSMLVVLVGVAALVGVSALVHFALVPDAARLLQFEFAGSAERIQALLLRGYPRVAWVDVVFIAGYGVALTFGARLVILLSPTASTCRLGRVAVVATVVAVVLDIIEKPLLLLAPRGDGHLNLSVAWDIAENLLLLLKRIGVGEWSGYVVAAQALAIAKWSLIGPAAAVAIFGIVTAVWRAVTAGRSWPKLDVVPSRDGNDGNKGSDSGGPSGGPEVSRAAWRDHTEIPDASEDTGEIGICVSGGGIRSATFTFGALEALRDVVTRARWLVSVSGGGYAVGAMRLALQRDSMARPADVYCAGSSELDYTRRHGRYLADGAAEWLRLGVIVLRGFLANMLILGLLVVVAARVLAHGYALISVDLRGAGFSVQPGVWWAIGVLVGGWLLSWTVSILFESLLPKSESSESPSEPPQRNGTVALGRTARWMLGVAGVVVRRCAVVLQRAKRWMLGIAGVVALTGVVLPLLAWVSVDSPWSAMPVRVQGLSALAGYVAALIALGKRPSVRAVVGKEVKRVRGWWRTAGAGGRNIMAAVGVYLGLVALIAGFVVLFGAMLAFTGAPADASGLPWQMPEWSLTLVLAAVLCIVAAVDQVHWSLHPFYRERLASAFAVRRVCKGDHVEARAYDFEERTELHNYCGYVAGFGFPEVIFSCAAHVSGDLAPPGRRVVPWTMSATRVGGQIHGWVPTRELYRAVSSTIQRDLTVQAAQAISGAAIASQMGVLQHAYAKLLTLSNIRLGSWLPNPAYLNWLHCTQLSWVVPRLPAKRGITTLLRELIGSFPADGPLVYVTDGGHYENLGLVELLRRRPATVYCVDASGDHGGVPETLAEAIQLAREELGVEVKFDNAAALGAGPDQPPPIKPADQLTACLMHRFARTCVITGTIIYPDIGPGYPQSTAKIIFGKAVITAETPFPLLAYASKNPAFPSDSTSDQWFDASQFDAYHSLGRHIGAIMLDRLPVYKPILSTGSQLGAPDRPEQPPSSNGAVLPGAPARAMVAGGAVPSARGEP